MTRNRRDWLVACEGFTVAEVLVSAALVLTVSGTALALMDRMRAVSEGQAGGLDVRQRARVATATLERDLLSAGAGPTLGATVGPLVSLLPPVVPYRRGQTRDDAVAGVFYRSDALSIMFVPPTSALARVRWAVPSGSTVVVEAAPNCGPGWHDRVCGFAQDTRVALFDPSGAYDLATVTRVDGTSLVLQLGAPTAARYDAGGAVVAEVSTHTYYVDADGGGDSPRLMHYDGFRTDRSIVDHVVGLAFQYFGDPEPPRLAEANSLDPRRGPRTSYGPRPPAHGVDDPADSWGAGENCLFIDDGAAWTPRLSRLADHGSPVLLEPASLRDGPWCVDASTRGRYDADLLRVRRIRVQLRVQAASPSLRGPAGYLFARAGTSSSIERLSPDLQVQFDVSPRNLNFGR